MSVYAIVLAAGSGSRLSHAGLPCSKQFLQYRNRPLFWHSARMFAKLAPMAGIIFVFPEDQLDSMRIVVEDLASRDRLDLPTVCVSGGERRQDSVRCGLDALPNGATRILVHDSARPFATAHLGKRLLAALDSGAPAAIPGIAVTDTIKIVQDGEVESTPERSRLVAVQTPQAFDLPTLQQAHALAEQNNWDVTDDAMLIEKMGHTVSVIAGEPGNIKITNPEDLKSLEDNTLEQKFAVSGFGYDVHKFGEGRPFVLGGVPVPGAPEVIAHSDGDVLVHALVDAILGCVGMGDIGDLFPDTDPRYDAMDSGIMLSEVMIMARREGLELQHVDLTIICQTPKISPHKNQIRQNIARMVGLPVHRVNIKATTEEGLGFTGRKQGIKAVALANALVPAR